MPTECPATSLTIHLVDSAKGTVVQTWRFQGRDRVVIGRAPESDIRLADRLVSRMHVEFTYDPSTEKWALQSHGRNGTLVQGDMVTQAPVKDRMYFQLGPSGPKFQLLMTHENSTDWATAIGDTDMSTLEFLSVDEKKRNEEVQQLADGASFQAILAKAKKLRQSNAETSSGEEKQAP